MVGDVPCSVFLVRGSRVEIDGAVDQVALEVVLRALWFIVDEFSVTRQIMNLGSCWSHSEQSIVTTVKAFVRQCLLWFFCLI